MVYILLAEGFEEMEALVPADLLRRAGVEVALVGLEELVVTGGHGIAVKADLTLAQADPDSMKMLVLPGGLGGVQSMQRSDAATRFIKAAAAENRMIAAICAAPTLLAELGLLDGRRGVCYPGMEHLMPNAQVTPEEKVVVDGPFITSRAAGTAYDFGLTLVEILTDSTKAEAIRNGIHYRT